MPNPKLDVTYLDHNASAPLPGELIRDVEAILRESVASPSSLHKAGRQGRRIINDVTSDLAKFIRCDPQDIIWTSGASESNSWVFYSVAAEAKERGHGPKFLVSSIEHESVLMASKAAKEWSQSQDAVVDFIASDPSGRIDLEDFERRLAEQEWDLVSVMAANNETGVIQPIERIGARCRKRGVPFHSDAVQVLGKRELAVDRQHARYLTFSGHKLGAPKGLGFVVVRGEGRLLRPLIHGKQQKSLRGGTEDPLGIGILGKVVEYHRTEACERKKARVASWQNEFERAICDRIPGTVIHGSKDPDQNSAAPERLWNTTFVGFEAVDGDGILLNLDLAGICASSGSACTSGSLDPSHVLLAMGADRAIARSSVRFSSGVETVASDFERVLDVLPGIVDRVRKAGKRIK